MNIIINCQTRTEAGRRKEWILLELAVASSVLSQIREIESFFRPLMFALWISVIVFCCVRQKIRITASRFARNYMIAFLVFCLFCAICSLKNSDYLSANYLRVFAVPLIVTIAAENSSTQDKDIDKEKLLRVVSIYCFFALILALWAHVSFFSSYSRWLSTQVYLYSSKNSAGQIWISAVIILLFYCNYRSNWQKIVSYAVCVYLLVMTGIAQCRTAIFAFSVALAVYALIRAKKKFAWIVFLGSFSVAVWYIPATRQFINQALLLTKYAGTDFNTFSSGRVVLWKRAIDTFSESPIIGVGKYYVDSSYLSILAETGIVGFIIIEFIWLTKQISCFSYHGEQKERALLFLLTIFYIVESLLEGFPPFGPGVSSFMYWLLSAYIIHANREPEHTEKEQIV